MAEARWVHPAAEQVEVWPGPAGYPWAETGIRLWTREGILRRVGPTSLFVTWTCGGFSEPTNGNLTMFTRSDDNGATWSQPEALFRHSWRGLFTTELFCPAPGEVHAFLQTYALGTWMTQIHSYRAVSRDGGRSWSGPHSLPGGIDNVWVNQGVVHSSGRWVIPVSWAEQCGPEWCEPWSGRPPAAPVLAGGALPVRELPHGSDDPLLYRAAFEWANANHRYAVGMILSDDGGQSFRRAGYLWHDDPRHFFEPKIVELSDRRLALLTREMTDGWLWASDSADGGETWSPLRRTEIPNPSSKVKLLRAADGRIFLLHNPTNRELNTGGSARNPLSLWISDDDLRTWRVKVDLVRDSGCNLNYPDGYLDEATGTIHFAWEDAQRVYLMRVPMDLEA